MQIKSNNKRNYIAFIGKKYTIEWYFDERGKSQALEYFDSLKRDSIHVAKKLAYLFEFLADRGSIRDKTKFRHEGDQIYAFKPLDHRFLCFFFHGKKVIVTNGFEKKTDKMPPEEKEKALRFEQSYIDRNKLEKYYGK